MVPARFVSSGSSCPCDYCVNFDNDDGLKAARVLKSLSLLCARLSFPVVGNLGDPSSLLSRFRGLLINRMAAVQLFIVSNRRPMTYQNQTRPWCLVRQLPKMQRVTVDRFRRYQEADARAQFLRRQMPASQYVVLFDPDSGTSLDTVPQA